MQSSSMKSQKFVYLILDCRLDENVGRDLFELDDWLVLDFDDEKRDEARFERRKKVGDERGEDGDEDRWVGATRDDLE